MYSLLSHSVIQRLQKESFSKKAVMVSSLLVGIFICSTLALIPAYIESGSSAPWEMLMPKADSSLVDLPVREMKNKGASSAAQERAKTVLAVAEEQFATSHSTRTSAALYDRMKSRADIQLSRVATVQKGFVVVGSTKVRATLLALIAEFRKDPSFARADVPVTDIAGKDGQYNFTLTLTSKDTVSGKK
jgi:hypothetical protein